jgi:hypothetical protein
MRHAIRRVFDALRLTVILQGQSAGMAAEIDAQPGGQPDAPVHDFCLASVVTARRLP